MATLLKARSSPFYGGAIPAASVKLGGHWDDILRHPSFTRKMFSYTRTTPWWRGGFLSLREKSFREHVEAADIGGEHGHEPEPLDTDDDQVWARPAQKPDRAAHQPLWPTAPGPEPP